MTSRPPRLILSALLLLSVAACNDSTHPTSGASSSANVQSEPTDAGKTGDVDIEVRDNSFAPDATEVAAGDTVTWDFATADRPHDVVFDDQRGSAILVEGTWSTTFDEPGTYAYECTLHSGMTGHINVTN